MAGEAGRLIALALALVGVAVGAATPADDPVHALAGRYGHHFLNGDVTGRSYWSDDVAEIVPVDATHAYVNFSLEFFNGHQCSLGGIAARDGDTLVYRGPPDDRWDGGEVCRLIIRRDGGKLAWDDGGTCKAHCGARGSFLGGDLPWSSKRPITYLARLKRSGEYRGALAEWRGAAQAR